MVSASRFFHYAENANRPHGFGTIDPINFTPYPKNPAIAKMFREIGYADELGSGVKNLYKYAKIYGGKDAQFIEGDVFNIIVPVGGGLLATEQATAHMTEQATEQAVLEFCETPKSTADRAETS